MGHLRKRLFTATLKRELVQSPLPHPSIRTRPRPAGVSGILQFLILRVRDARGYTPAIDQRIPTIRTRPRPAGVSGIFQFLILRVRGRTRVQPSYQPASPQHPYPPASRGREWNFSIPFLRVRDARGYTPEIDQRIPTIRTRPRPAGVNGILQFLLLRVRGRTRVQPSDQPASPQHPYPPASRGRERNFQIPHSPRAGTHPGTAQRTTRANGGLLDNHSEARNHLTRREEVRIRHRLVVGLDAVRRE